MTSLENIHTYQLSDCCKAPYRSICADEGTCHAECTKCNKPCSFASPLEKQYWIDEKAEELDRLDYEEEIATRKGGIRTAVVVFDELRTALLEAHQRGAQEERAKIVEWVKENEYCSKCCSPKKFCPDWGKHASATDTTDLLHYLQQLKDNKTI